MKLEVIKKLPSFILNTAKGLRKFALNHEFFFLSSLNRQIYFSDYPLENLNNLPYKIIASLTTHKDRIEHIHYVLDSLYTQTLRPDEVHLYVTKGEYRNYPAILEKFKPWLKIIETKNIGSYKKFIPALLNAKKGDLIISLDDDFIYPSHLISTIYRHFLDHQDSLVTYCGFRDAKSNKMQGIAGGLGILWNPMIFNPSRLPFFFDSRLFWEEIGRNYDDGWIVLSCLEVGIEISCVSDKFQEEIRKFYELPNGKLYAISSSGKGENYISPQEKKSLQERTRKIIAGRWKSLNNKVTIK